MVGNWEEEGASASDLTSPHGDGGGEKTWRRKRRRRRSTSGALGLEGASYIGGERSGVCVVGLAWVQWWAGA